MRNFCLRFIFLIMIRLKICFVVFYFAFNAKAQDIAIKFLTPKSELSVVQLKALDRFKADLISVKSKITTLEIKTLKENSLELVKIKRSLFGFGNTLSLSFFNNSKQINYNGDEFSFDLDLKLLLNPNVLNQSQLERLIYNKFKIETKPLNNKKYLSFSRHHLSKIYEYLLFFNSFRFNGRTLLEGSKLKRLNRLSVQFLMINGTTVAAYWSGSEIDFVFNGFSFINLAHEFGHAVWYNVLNSDQRESYLSISWQDDQPFNDEFISDYAFSKPEEDFPEHFSAFFTKPERFEKNYTRKFTFLRHFMGDVKLQFDPIQNTLVRVSSGVNQAQPIRLKNFNQDLKLQNNGQVNYDATLNLEHGSNNKFNWLTTIAFNVPYLDENENEIDPFDIFSTSSNVFTLDNYQECGDIPQSQGHVFWNDPYLKFKINLNRKKLFKGKYRLNSIITHDRFNNHRFYPPEMFDFLMKRHTPLMDASQIGLAPPPKIYHEVGEVYPVPPKVISASDIKIGSTGKANEFFIELPKNYILSSTFQNLYSGIYLRLFDMCGENYESFYPLYKTSKKNVFILQIDEETECRERSIDFLEYSYHPYVYVPGTNQIKGIVMNSLYQVVVSQSENALIQLPPLNEKDLNERYQLGTLNEPVLNSIDMSQVSLSIQPNLASQDTCHCVFDIKGYIPIKTKDLKRLGVISLEVRSRSGHSTFLASSYSSHKIIKVYTSQIDGEDYSFVEFSKNQEALESGEYWAHSLSFSSSGEEYILPKTKFVKSNVPDLKN